MLAIKNATLVFPDFITPDATLLIKDDRILDYGERITIPEDAKIIDAEGLFVGPGLIDIHTHSDGKRYFHEDPETCAQTLLRHGVTGVLPALYNNYTKKEYLEHIEIIHSQIQENRCPNILGLYMEGPYLNPEFGCEKKDFGWSHAVRSEDYMEIVQKTSSLAKVWCIAPERENIREFVKDVREHIPGIVFSVAHSSATPEEIEDLIPYGLRLCTHHTNATGTAEYYPECRGVCVDEAVNYNHDIYAEIISDRKGIHVHPYMQRLIRKIKGRDRLILISDAFVADGPPIKGCEDVTDLNFDKDGEIAGSKMTLDIACRNILIHTGCSVCDAFHYASYNPSVLLNMRNQGEIRRGNIANLIFVDSWFHVKKTILKGEVYYDD